MYAIDCGRVGRRQFLRTAGTAVTGLALGGLPLDASGQTDQSRRPMKIGVIGSGRIGGTLGGLWVKAGHEVMFSARHLDEVKKLAERLGPLARAGTPREAAVFGEAVLISVPYSALPQIGQDLAAELRGKIVLDTCNPIPSRDGEMASGLVEDAGFEPVMVGPLAEAKKFDPGTPVFGQALTRRELRRMLGLGS